MYMLQTFLNMKTLFLECSLLVEVCMWVLLAFPKMGVLCKVS
jgi:hypothetical protein